MTFTSALRLYGRMFGHQPAPEPKTETPSHPAPRRHLAPATPTAHDDDSPWAAAMARLTPEERAWRSQ